MNNNPNFIGTYHYSMDAKNRLAIPSKFRYSLNSENELILSQGMEGCLDVYIPSTWRRLGEKLDQFPLKNKKDQRAVRRILFSSAASVELDEDGRILIPQTLSTYADFKKEIVIAGVGEKIELWAKPQWDRYQKQLKHTFIRYANQLGI